MQPLLSIIVPVYNTGPYLERCLTSVFQQTIKDIEIIVVDDGSGSTTANLCDQLACGDSRIRVIHKKNEGVSVARNTGISLATGHYLGFVDSDDWIAPDMFLSLVNAAEKEKVDIVMCDALTIRDGKSDEIDTFSQIPQSCCMPKSQITPAMLCEIAGSACRGVYRHSFVTENQIRFPVGLKFSEDRIFNVMALGHVNRFYYIKQPFYFRYVRKGSAAYGYHPDAAEVIANAHKQINSYLHSLWGKEFLEAYQWQELGLFYGAMNAIFLPNGLSVRGRYDKMKELCSDAEFLTILSQTRASDIRAWLIRNNQILLVFILTLFIRLKHRLLNQ